MLDGWKTKAGIGVGVLAVGGLLVKLYADYDHARTIHEDRIAWLRSRASAPAAERPPDPSWMADPRYAKWRTAQGAVGYYAGGGLLGLLR
tara:strand:- start:813 stop:1082 length:270 start_codon:yes stop_codon:yes gene_type:complete